MGVGDARVLLSLSVGPPCSPRSQNHNGWVFGVSGLRFRA